MNIILPTLREERRKTYCPFLPICPKTGKVLEIPLLNMDRKSGKVVFENNGEDIELKGRPIALKRSFENIIQNGLTYGNKVYVHVHKGNNRALVTIEDDGPGIPEDQYKNVFKPFFRLDKSRSLNQSGVGLGLAIVEDIINSHGGNIQLSKSNYNGLQVRISLPF